jgi:hypothetical protein
VGPALRSGPLVDGGDRRLRADPAPPERAGAGDGRRGGRLQCQRLPGTIGGVAKSLGEPRASILQLRGVNQELAITIAWDITWYQYRVSAESAMPVRLEARGHELDQLDSLYKNWNARVDTEGRVVPDIARI